MRKLADHLFRSGVLESGDKAMIEEARQRFRKLYQANQQVKYRSQRVRREVFFTHEEWKVLERFASSHGKKLKPAYLKEMMLATVARAYLVPEPEHLKALQLNLLAIGGNINQMAKAVNTHGHVVFNPMNLYDNLNRLEDLITEFVESPPELIPTIRLELQRNPTFKNQIETLFDQLTMAE